MMKISKQKVFCVFRSFLSHGKTFGAGGGGMRKLVACKEDDCAARVGKLKQTLLKLSHRVKLLKARL